MTQPIENIEENALQGDIMLQSSDPDAEKLDLDQGYKKIRDMYPEKYGSYFISNRMYDYLVGINNPDFMQKILRGDRIMVKNPTNNAWIYPNTKGSGMQSSAKGGTRGPLITTSLKKMLRAQVRHKNPFTKRLETLSAHEHVALAAICQAIKKGNFRHLEILLERTEGKVAEEINQNITMGLGAALKQLNRMEEEGGLDDLEDSDSDNEEQFEVLDFSK